MPVLRVVRPGMLTTVQDLGRWGHQISGVPVAGPMDEYSHRLANHLVGNAATAAALEVTLIGPELEADTDVLCAVAGALFTLHTDGGVAPMHEAFLLRRGARLRFGRRTAGARAALAVAGGLDVDPIFGSRATSLISRIGPFGGRAVMAGDVIPIAQSTAAARISRATPLTLPAGGARLRVIPGPHVSRFTSDAFDTLFAARYTVTPSSNRMGYRLEGPRLTHARGADILSDPTALGSL